MNIYTTEGHVYPSTINGFWRIENPLLTNLNSENIQYKILSSLESPESHDPVFYLHGLGGTIDDTPDLNEEICRRTRLIRVGGFASQNQKKLVAATFGDICSILNNSRCSIYAIADLLSIDYYNIVAHSWGGFVACLAGLNDHRCKKIMMLGSTPDICDALSNMYEMMGSFSFVGKLFGDIFMGKIRVDAERAKFGKAVHQAAWDAINPFSVVSNRALEALIFNREEDRIMKRWNVEHYVEHARRYGLANFQAEFIRCPELSDPHEMPPWKFMDRLRYFLFN